LRYLAGALRVTYRITPHVQAERLPFVGMTLDLSAPAKKVDWLGLGPMDAWPNEQAAPTLGLWSVPSGQDGVKAARWAEVSLAQGGRMRIEAPGWIATHKARAASIDILSTLAGHLIKFGPAEVEAEQVKAGEGTSFTGTFTLTF
jgi:beta-galactosidase